MAPEGSLPHIHKSTSPVPNAWVLQVVSFPHISPSELCMHLSYPYMLHVFVSDKMPYVMLKGHWCNIIILNLHAPTEEPSELHLQSTDTQANMGQKFVCGIYFLILQKKRSLLFVSGFCPKTLCMFGYLLSGLYI
jgi:hypothetical protein